MRSNESNVAPRETAPVLLLTDAELAAITGGIIGSSPTSKVRSIERSSHPRSAT